MRIFLDANVLVTVLCNEYPRFTECARVLSLCDDKRFHVYTSPLCIAIAHYYSEKKNGAKLARSKAEMLVEKLKITTMNEQCAQRTMANKKVLDIEDGFEYYSAIDAKCKAIITYNKGDFHFSDIEVLDGMEFLLKYAVKK